MRETVHVMSVEETVNAVLDLVPVAASEYPQSLPDMILLVGQSDPYRQRLALKLLQTKLHPGSTITIPGVENV
jgi:hypothetical protein